MVLLENSLSLRSAKEQQKIDCNESKKSEKKNFQYPYDHNILYGYWSVKKVEHLCLMGKK